MSWLEHKYISMVGHNLRNFKRKSDSLWNFSCPSCGDSFKNKNKARGFIYLQKSKYMFHCHNCMATQSFGNFLKDVNLNLYNEYKMELYLDSGNAKDSERFAEKFVIKSSLPVDGLKSLKKISQLHHDHVAKQYIESRMIPTPLHSQLYWASEFKRFTNNLLPNKFDKKSMFFDEGRIVIPFLNANGKLFGYQGRSIGENDAIRYITIMLNETEPRFYGLNHIDMNRDVLVFEGPIDSMFIENSIASAGGELFRELNQIASLKDNVIIVYDNERRHPDTVKKMKQAINKGFRVCLWPESITLKDINAIIIEKFKGAKNIPSEKIKEYGDYLKNIIIKSSVSGLNAELELTMWQKSAGVIRS